MGQRLNIEIVKNGRVLANSYYHWSGFSNSAINLVIQIIQHYEYIKKYNVEKYIKNQDLLLAIRLLEETGAGLNNTDIARNILKDETMNLKLKECQGRNEGIIGIIQEDIEETRAKWDKDTHILQNKLDYANADRIDLAQQNKELRKENEELRKDYYNVINKIENKIDILDIAISECIYIDDDDKAYKKAVKKDKLCLLNQKRALQELLEGREI